MPNEETMQTMTFSEKQYHEHFHKLLVAYRKERAPAQIKEDDVRLLMLVFPGILVAQADGFIDTTEMVYLVKLTRDLASNFRLNVSENIKDELRYLTRNTAHWYEPFTTTLKFMIAAEDRGVDVADIMVMVATSSSGDLINNVLYSARTATSTEGNSGVLAQNPNIQFLSKEEREDIRQLARILGLYNNRQAAERLAIQLDEQDQF